MSLKVQKFGGTSVGSVERIQAVARRVVEAQKQGNSIVVVVSAMAGETSRLIGLAKKISPYSDCRDTDMLLASGEQVSVGLLSLAVNAICKKENLSFRAKSFLGYQLGIKTDGAFSKARIQSINVEKIKKQISEKTIPIIAGFQGVDQNNNITTLGRGGTDTSAVAIAAAIQADECEIFTDVDGVYTTDPKLCKQARKINQISFEEMMELAGLGAKVLQIRCVELAANYQLKIHVRSSFDNSQGTKVVPMEGLNRSMEKLKLAGVAADQNQIKFTLKKIPNEIGADAQIFQALAEASVLIDVIVKEYPEGDNFTLSFTASESEAEQATSVLKELKARVFKDLEVLKEPCLSKVSIVGVGMQHHPGVAAKMFSILASEKIPIRLVSTSEIKISCMIPGHCVKNAVSSLHAGFGLDTE